MRNNSRVAVGTLIGAKPLRYLVASASSLKDRHKIIQPQTAFSWLRAVFLKQNDDQHAVDERWNRTYCPLELGLYYYCFFNTRVGDAEKDDDIDHDGGLE